MKAKLAAVLVSPTMSVVLASGVSAASKSAKGSEATVVISEIAVRGPNGAADEFIELYNRTSEPVYVGGWYFYYFTEDGIIDPVPRIGIPEGTYIQPYSYYLITSSYGTYYSGPTAPDVEHEQFLGLADSGSILLVNSTGEAQDLVGWNGAAFVEGDPLRPSPTKMAAWSADQ